MIPTMRNTPTRRSKTRGTALGATARLAALLEAQDRLRQALAHAKAADAPKLAGRIRAAIKSCGGAVHHAKLAPIREARQARDRQERT